MKLLGKYLTLFVAGLLLSLFAWRTWDVTSLPMIAAFWGIILVTPALMDFVPWLFRLQKRLALQQLSGIHYEFGATRIRIFYAARLIWIATEDLHQALGIPLTDIDRQRLKRGGRHLIIPGTKLLGIAEPHVHAYVASLNNPEGSRFIWWFEHDVAKPLHTKIAQGLPIAESVGQNQD